MLVSARPMACRVNATRRGRWMGCAPSLFGHGRTHLARWERAEVPHQFRRCRRGCGDGLALHSDLVSLARLALLLAFLALATRSVVAAGTRALQHTRRSGYNTRGSLCLCRRLMIHLSFSLYHAVPNARDAQERASHILQDALTAFDAVFALTPTATLPDAGVSVLECIRLQRNKGRYRHNFS